MKISKLFALMKRRKRIVVMQGKTAQWVGDGVSLYPIYNLPKLSERTMQTILDINDDAWDKFTFDEYDVMRVSEDDFSEGQIDLQPMEIMLHWKGSDLIPLYGGGRIYFIMAKYLKPFTDAILLSYSWRKDEKVIAVNEGMLLSALIVPVEVTDPVFRETLYRLYDFTRRQAGEEE